MTAIDARTEINAGELTHDDSTLPNILYDGAGDATILVRIDDVTVGTHSVNVAVNDNNFNNATSGDFWDVESFTFTVVCSPRQSLIQTAAADVGDCPAGGTQIDIGVDDDCSDTLEAGEIDNTFFACNGETGPAGNDGSDALVEVAAVNVGDGTCPAGGQEFSSGTDDNDNDVLDAGEIDQTVKVCNGVDGANGTDGADGADGADEITRS